MNGRGLTNKCDYTFDLIGSTTSCIALSTFTFTSSALWVCVCGSNPFDRPSQELLNAFL